MQYNEEAVFLRYSQAAAAARKGIVCFMATDIQKKTPWTIAASCWESSIMLPRARTFALAWPYHHFWGHYTGVSLAFFQSHTWDTPNGFLILGFYFKMEKSLTQKMKSLKIYTQLNVMNQEVLNMSQTIEVKPFCVCVAPLMLYLRVSELVSSSLLWFVLELLLWIFYPSSPNRHFRRLFFKKIMWKIVPKCQQFPTRLP